MENYDFAGWATVNEVLCSDGRVIRKNAFMHQDGMTLPMVWNHQHNDPDNVLGHVLLENHEKGMYVYGFFNDTESGQSAKQLVQHGDIDQLSIYANQLKQDGNNVTHGMLREVSLVLAGANPEAHIDLVIKHGEGCEEEGVIYSGESISLYHAAEKQKETEKEKDMAEETKKDEQSEEKKEKSVKEILDTLNPEQKEAVELVVGMAIEDAQKNNNNKDKEEGDDDMKHNVFDQDTKQTNVLSHADQSEILEMAKRSNVGSLQEAIRQYAETHKETLAHGFVDEDGNPAIETLFPEYKDVRPGAPELIERDLTWVGEVMRKTHKSPISRIRTRQADARGVDVRAKGYKKGTEKTVSGNIKLMGRTTDPQTVYRKDSLHRDDIIDITEFDVVEYQYGIMKHNLNEDIALATMVGDLREDGDADKISEEHIRPIWKDDELYTIHYDVDIAKAKAELQGSDTSVHFGENYVFSEALVTASLYSREEYKGSGNLEFYCTPHLLNVMLLARDMNGRRIYDSKADLAKALNVSAIHTAEQFEGLTRTTADGKTKKLLGIMVNLADYQHGSTKGGEITRFEQFDIDFNQNKYLIETRLSGALTRIKSAIALEEDVTAQG